MIISKCFRHLFFYLFIFIFLPTAYRLKPVFLHQLHILMAYQIAFDLEENATQDFLHKVSNDLSSAPAEEKPAEGEAMETDDTSKVGGGDGFGICCVCYQVTIFFGDISLCFITCNMLMNWFFTQPSLDRFAKIRSILSGEESIKLHLEFLYRNNHTDLLILKNTKVGVAKLYIKI